MLRPVIDQLREASFSYISEIEVDSPRVKNIALKQYFCLAYFVMMFIKIYDQLNAEDMERSLFMDMDQ